MSYTEMIHAYFDEGLDGYLEDVLFEKLAQSPDLRREFTEHLRLHLMILQDMSSSTPPVDITRSLFTALEMIPPAVGIASPAAPMARRARPAAPSRRLVRGSHALTSAATALAVLLLVWMIRPFEVTRVEYVAAAPVPPGAVRTPSFSEAVPPPATARAVHEDRTTPAGDAREVHATRGNNATIESSPGSSNPSIAEHASLPAPVDQPGTVGGHVDGIPVAELRSSSGAIDSITAPPTTHGIASAPSAPIADVPDLPVAIVPGVDQQLYREALGANAMSRLPYFSGKDLSDMRGVFSHVILEMRIINGRSSPQVDLPYSAANMFKDLAFGIAYKIDDKNAIGLEYGRETFGQEYTSYESVNNDPLIVRQANSSSFDAPWLPKTYIRNMLLDWVGASWKVSFRQFELWSFIYPYMRTFVGATKQGPLGKMRLGFEIAPTRYTMFNLGVEGTFLRYQVDQVSNRTTKLGVTLGITAGF
jgi:hypothetical protein